MANTRPWRWAVEVIYLLILFVLIAWLPSCFEVMPKRSIEMETEVPGADKSNDGKACDEEAGSRLSLLSLFIALIGGAAFSLEAFEAFPML
mmetsp:Transcript_73772/g.130296  ORF Transcript_73772/g.130296 Transcript_73772/m.130296 type:complete len:91 (+) Transcript_73772:128-400(+)